MSNLELISYSCTNVLKRIENNFVFGKLEIEMAGRFPLESNFFVIRGMLRLEGGNVIFVALLASLFLPPLLLGARLFPRHAWASLVFCDRHWRGSTYRRIARASV